MRNASPATHFNAFSHGLDPRRNLFYGKSDQATRNGTTFDACRSSLTSHGLSGAQSTGMASLLRSAATLRSRPALLPRLEFGLTFKSLAAVGAMVAL